MPAFVRTPATSQPSALSRASPVMKSPIAALPDTTSFTSAKLHAASAKVPLPETPINRITGVTLNSSFGFQCTSNLWCCTSSCCHQDSRCPSRIEASYSEAHRHSCTFVLCSPSLAFSHFALSIVFYIVHQINIHLHVRTSSCGCDLPSKKPNFPSCW